MKKKIGGGGRPTVIFYFFSTVFLTSPRTGWLLGACITNLSRIHGTLFKLLCPQVNVNADADVDDAEPQSELPLTSDFKIP